MSKSASYNRKVNLDGACVQGFFSMCTPHFPAIR